MATKEEQLKKLAARYAAGDCTPEELQRIEAWYDRFDMTGSELPPAAEIARAAGEATHAAIIRIRNDKNRLRIRQLWLPVMKLAAVWLLISSVAIIIYRAGQPSPVTWQQLSAAPGTQKQVTMPDGSVISLNAGSVIRYSSAFGAGRREIELKGEAFFYVVHDAKQPFIVHTRQLDINVLGTSYNVKAYPDEQETTVGVVSGMVGITDPAKLISKAVVLTPGQQLVYTKKGFSHKTVGVAGITAWQQQILEFKGETFESISRVLARTYGVAFVFKDRTLLNKRFQFKSKKESLPNIMKLLSISGGGFPYNIKGRQVIVGR